jgi:hypothetical protein
MYCLRSITYSKGKIMKTRFIVLLLTLIVALTACGGNQESATEQPSRVRNDDQPWTPSSMANSPQIFPTATLTPGPHDGKRHTIHEEEKLTFNIGGIPVEFKLKDATGTEAFFYDLPQGLRVGNRFSLMINSTLYEVGYVDIIDQFSVDIIVYDVFVTNPTPVPTRQGMSAQSPSN